MSDEAFFDEHEASEPDCACRHWQGAGACTEICACGHGCAEHHDAGWCGRCACLAWVDGPEDVSNLPAPTDDAWELCDVFTDEQEDYDDASGF